MILMFVFHFPYYFLISFLYLFGKGKYSLIEVDRDENLDLFENDFVVQNSEFFNS